MSEAIVHSDEHREDHWEFVQICKKQHTGQTQKKAQISDNARKHLSAAAREIALAMFHHHIISVVFRVYHARAQLHLRCSWQQLVRGQAAKLS